jgi:hypothetical protein
MDFCMDKKELGSNDKNKLKGFLASDLSVDLIGEVFQVLKHRRDGTIFPVGDDCGAGEFEALAGMRPERFPVSGDCRDGSG